MKTKIFIDGKEGTTGLKIFDRFKNRNDLEIMLIDEDKRKDKNERAKFINESDITFLCLPDNAAIESASLIDKNNNHTKIIDASTAHRTNPEWAYGFPELSSAHREKIKNSSRIAVPGCYASGFISLVYPLVTAGILPKDYPVTCHAVSGYSGAGKKMIAVYEGDEMPYEYNSPRQYALAQNHKHLPEMQKICGLDYPPVFNPIVDNYYAGMVVTVPIITRLLNGNYTASDIQKALSEHYKNEHFVKVMELGGTETLPDGFLAANTLEGTNDMQIFVCGNDERVLLCSRLDNLGKGASGAAVQCMNIVLGIDEVTGLE